MIEGNDRLTLVDTFYSEKFLALTQLGPKFVLCNRSGKNNFKKDEVIVSTECWTLHTNDLCSTKSDFPIVRFVEYTLFFFSTRSNQFFVSTCSTKAVIIYKMSQLHYSWKKQKATTFPQRNSSKQDKFIRKGRNRGALAWEWGPKLRPLPIAKW